MQDQIHPILGIKLAILVAGCAGGVVSLSYVKRLSTLQSINAVISGMLSAAYLTPAAIIYLNLDIIEYPDLENVVAFFIGLTGMHLIPALLAIAERFKLEKEGAISNGNS